MEPGTWLCCAYSLSCIQLSATAWTVARQTPLSMGISPGKNTGVGCHALLQEIFPIQGLNPALSPTLQADSVPSEKLKYLGRPAHGWHLKNVCWMGRIIESLNEKYM